MNSIQQEKAKQRRSKFANLLRDMFLLNQPELDFGLYRILHAKKDDVERFIDIDLPKLAQDAFKDFTSQDKIQLEKAIQEARQAAEAAGFNPDESPKVKELKAQFVNGFDTAREEGEVYDALVTFFSRYYDEGDFISRRVYKDDTYAIPYQGEEVVLHWANKDQYYIKSSEYLRDYTFRLNPLAQNGEDPLRVHFKLVDATAGAKDNNKETDDSKRQFILDIENPFEFITGEPDAEGNRYQELVCRFEFRPATFQDWEDSIKIKATAAAQKKAPTQEHLVDITVTFLLGENSNLDSQWREALNKPYMKVNDELANYSTLKGQLNNYVKKNKFDYFIHKDLGGFLSQELDFYIKNELIQWDDLAALKNNFAHLAPLFSKLEVIRNLGEKIIAFLAQLENFQKKLWLKRKFVTETNYCITLDRVPKVLYPVICENQTQISEWIKLFAIDEIKGDLTNPAFSSPLTIDFLEANQNLVLDTQFFSDRFKAELLVSIESFDEQCDGLLIHSENFQALSLLKNRYIESIDCIYADPPYNTSASEILYKNNYKHSSWLSLLDSRICLSKLLLKDDGVSCYTIDDFEFDHLRKLLNHHYGDDNLLGTLVIRNNPSGRSTAKGVSISHEYAIFHGSSEKSVVGRLPRNKKQLERYDEKDAKGAYEWTNFRKHGGLRADSPKMYYPFFVSATGYRLPEMEWSETRFSWIILESPADNEQVLYPIDESGQERRWKWALTRVQANPDEFKVANDRSGNLAIYVKTRINDEGVLPLTWWDKKEYSATAYGTNYLKDIFSTLQMFSYPKSIYAVEDILRVLSNDNSSITLDYFAGSGTTGHAVINLNREDDGKRKYILMEMGDYFDTVLKPRLVKAVYAKNWKNGKPTSRDTGISHCFKYIRLESYEDTLGNLMLNKRHQDLFSQANDSDTRQAYVMNYMLDVETRGSQSLLNIEQFVNPTEYQLNVRSVSGDETLPVKVDLLETFNYLLGLKVEHIAAPMYFDAVITTGEYGRKQAEVTYNPEGKWWFRTVYGKNRNGQYVLVVWRNLPSVIEASNDASKRTEGVIIDNAVLDAVLVERLKIRLTESLDDEIDILYVNGDNNIAIPRDRQGNPMEQARVQLIEDAFKRLMFADTEGVD